MSRPKNSYGFGSFLFDATLTCLTGGFWLIRVFCRESRRAR